DSQQIFTIISAGIVGALAYTFCDSFWYSAVEGEVYGSSSFFTALVFWAILKWEDESDKPEADRWIIFIFYMMGLSIGIHLLNLLTIPAIVMVYYYKRYTPTAWGSVFAFLIGCMITGLIQKFVIQYTIKGAAWFDIRFVNDLSLPFFSGFAFFFIALTALLVYGIRYAIRKKYYLLKIGIWCISFMLIGYSTYFTTMIRSNADPAAYMFGLLLTGQPVSKGATSILEARINIYLREKMSDRTGATPLLLIFFHACGIIVMIADKPMYIKTMGMWRMVISRQWETISVILFHIRRTGCTCGTFSGIFPANRMTSRDSEISGMEMPSRAFLLLIIFSMVTRAKCPTASIPRIKPITGCTPCPSSWV